MCTKSGHILISSKKYWHALTLMQTFSILFLLVLKISVAKLVYLVSKKKVQSSRSPWPVISVSAMLVVFPEMIQREVGSSVIVKRCVTEQGESITSWKVHCALPSKPTAIRSVYVVQCARSSHWSVLTLHRKDPMEWMYEGNNGRTDRSSHAHHVHQLKMWKY